MSMDISGLNTAVLNLSRKIDNINTRLSSIDPTILSILGDIISLRGDITSLSSSVINIDTEVKDLSENTSEAIKYLSDATDKNIKDLSDATSISIQDLSNSTNEAINNNWKNIYPIGSIYIGVNNSNPKDLFGGEWEKIENRFLLASGESYTLNSTGGESEHALTINELPNICGTMQFRSLSSGNNVAGVYSINENNCLTYTDNNGSTWSNAIVSETNSNTCDTIEINFGENETHNNMPPYLVVNIWKRIA